MEQQRLNFSDYSAIEQAHDVQRAERKKQNDVYIMKVDGVWNAYLPRKRNGIIISGEKEDDIKIFTEGVTETLGEMHITPRFRCINNEGVATHIKQHTNIMKRIHDRY